MQAKPIIFNGDMVRAILDGRKTQTRRVVRHDDDFALHRLMGCVGGRAQWLAMSENMDFIYGQKCPYGQPGDLLWVRETWSKANNPLVKTTFYCATDGENCTGRQSSFSFIERETRWRPSIHMPRWASRITLEITGVRVERLQDISEDDAKAEGCDNSQTQAAADIGWYEKPRKAFARLWGSIYGQADWHANPWVWVIEFKPHLVNVDEILKG